MAQSLERLINLIGKPGDRLVIYDRHKPEESFVVLGIGEYERLLAEGKAVRDLTEDELIDKINRDIALWKEEQVPQPPHQTVSSFSSEEEARDELEEQPKPKGNLWTIPQNRRRPAE